MTNDLEIRGNIAYVACWWDGFRVVDFQNPQSPVLIGHAMGWFNGAIPGTDYCYVQALDVEGDYIYLIDYEPFSNEDTRGLYILNISDPANPVLISRYTGLQSAGHDINVEGDYAYVADNNGGLEVIDVTLKQSPQAVGYISLPDVPEMVKVQENHAFLSCYINGGVQVVNVSNPGNPVIDGYYARSGCFALGINTQGHNIFLADGAAGFQIYETPLITGIRDPEKQAGADVSASPNPFNSHTLIKCPSGCAELYVYDAAGRLQTILRGEPAGEGTMVFGWNGTTSSGTEVPAGIYYFRPAAGSFSGKLVKIRQK
jgi:hypothetical protein